MGRSATNVHRWISFLLCCWTCRASSAQSVAHLFSNTTDLPPIPEGITVGAYYYPWHGNDFHRQDGYLRDKLIPRHQPTLGEYDDTLPEVVAQHLAWSRQANINLWVTSWWGPGFREDVTISEVIMKHTDLGDHQIALFYESANRVKQNEEWTTQRVAPDMGHICQTFFDNDNYYKVDGKPVMAMYLTRKLHSNGVLGEVTQIMRDTARKVCGTEIYLIGDQVWSNAPSPGEQYLPFDYLDAVTNYDMYGNTNHPPYAGQETVDLYYKKQADWRERAIANGVNYVPAVSPGYNDRGVRLLANHVGLSRRLTAESEPGTLFVAQLQQARYLVDPGVGNLLLVNSFNEWHEDSQIEPCIGDPTTEPQEYTNGIEYEGYGELYLDILRAATCDSNCQLLEKLRLHAFEGPRPPTDILVGAYYYAWHGNDFNGNRPFLRETLDSRQEPVLGHYDDTDPFTIAKHLEWSREANIGLWIASWISPDDQIDSTLRNAILPELGDMKIALLYEVRNRVKEEDSWDLELVASDMKHICKAFLFQENYFTSHGRPVIFLALTRVLYDKGVLESVVSTMKSIASIHGYELYIVGDQVWSSAPVEEIYSPFFVLDAVTNYDVYGDMGAHGYAGQEAVEKYYQRQRNWRDKAWNSTCGFVPAVTPGWNNGGFNPQSNKHALARKLTEEHPQGSFFAASVEKARYLVDSDLSNLMVVTTFNRWNEDTQIEPVTGKPTSTPENRTEGLTYYGYGNLYLDILRNATRHSDLTQSNSEDGTFYPLRCNVVSSLATMECQTKWTSLFGTDDEHEMELEIPCATCVILDHPGPLLKLSGGLDIQGKLLIPDGYQIAIETPFIRVQGKLQIESNKVIDGAPEVRITLVQGEPGIEKFTPSSSNGDACGVQQCDPGPKSIFVAGGALDIRGIPDKTPTWVHVVDVVTEDNEPPFQRPPECPSDGKYLEENFENASTSRFTGTLGANLVFANSLLRIFDRKAIHHGAQIDLTSIRDCLRAKDSYMISMRIRLNREGMEEKLTKCAKGKQCFQLYSDYMTDENLLISSTKYKLNAEFKYGEWMSIETQIKFGVDEIDASNAFLALRIGGGELKADIEIQSFSLQLAPNDVCSTLPVDCRDLVACNGDAELGSSPSQFSKQGDVRLFVEVEDGNHFWRVVREGATSVKDGIRWSVPKACVRANAVYRFRMKIRVHPDETYPDPVTTSVYIKLHRKGGAKQKRVIVCPESDGQWVQCDGYFVFDQPLMKKIKKVTMYFQTAGTAKAMYDVDDLSFKYVHMEGPVIGLVVPGEVKGKWAEGSEILITSHTLQWNEQHARKIVGIADYGGDGLVLLELDESIPRPPSQRNSDFPVEVALLSRNIVFEGAIGQGDESGQGGTTTVYHTPGVTQRIEGAEFRNFGHQGVSNRHPILFHYSQSLAGSTIAKNSIRNSQHGCIVLSSTDDVIVAENIAFDTVGHCFVLKDGSETGNTFRSNLGAMTRLSGAFEPIYSANEEVLDSSPATFLISNPSNVIEGNVGAGSEGEAFAIVLESKVRGTHFLEHRSVDPASLPLTAFRGNVAHSNKVRGVHLRMTPDYRSQTTYILIDGMQAYRNLGPGLLITNSENVVVDGCTFSDNRGNIDVHRSETILINNTSIVGMSRELQLLEATQIGLSSVLCPNQQTYLSAVEMNSFTRSRQGTGLSLKNLDISGFSDIEKCEEYVISVDAQSGPGAFDFFTQLSGVRIEDGAPRFNLCASFRNAIGDIYFIDQDSSLKPPQSNASGVSSVVSEASAALQFIPEEKKTYVDGLCYHYCKETCLGTVIFSVDPSDKRDLSLRVCERENAQNCASYSGTTYFKPRSTSATSFVSKGLYFYVTLPKGRYEVNFLDSVGTRAWPTFVEETFVGSLCEDSLKEGSLWLPPPPITLEECSDLIRNGDAETSETSHPSWIAGPGGMGVFAKEGIGTNPPSAAFCDISPNLGFDSTSAYSFGQYLDTRCLEEGRLYEVGASVRLMDKKTSQPVVMKCPDAPSCPKVGILFVSNYGFSWIQEVNEPSNVFANKKRARGLADNPDLNLYERVGGTLLIDAEMASASSAFFFVYRDNNDSDVAFCVDGVFLTLMPS